MKAWLLKVVTPLSVLLLGMILFGISLRFWDLGFPDHLTWDEHHFVKNARNYLLGRPDWNDHPPLGKLLMALSIRVFEDDAFYFRLPSAVLGTLTVLWGGLLAHRVFKTWWATGVAAAFLAFDGFLISYSRTGLLDGMLTSFSLLILYLMTYRKPWSVLLCGATLGCALSIKLSALTLVGPLLAIALVGLVSRLYVDKFPTEIRLFDKPLSGATPELLTYVPALVLAAFVYFSWWRLGLSMTDKESSWEAAWRAHQAMMEHHAALTDWEHPLLSRFWTWPLPARPIMISRDEVDFGVLRVMSTMGNPLLWWSVVAAFFYTALGPVRSWLKNAPLAPETWFLALAYLAYVSPWIFTNRDSYIYHYLPSYAVGLVLLSGMVTRHLRGRWLLYFLCSVSVVSSYYAPVWAKRPISPDALSARPFVRGLAR